MVLTFTKGRHTCMHNGYITDFQVVRRAMLAKMSDAAHAAMVSPQSNPLQILSIGLMEVHPRIIAVDRAQHTFDLLCSSPVVDILPMISDTDSGWQSIYRNHSRMDLRGSRSNA